MLSVSSGFKNAIKQLDVMSDGKVDIFDGVTTLNLTSDDISKIEIYGSAFNNDKVLGNLAQHSLTLELLGDKTKLITLGTEKTARVWIGVKVGASYEYVQFQDFIITEVKYNDTTRITKVLGTDSLIKLNKEWVDSNVYPITLKTYLESVLSHCGLSLENTSFLNSGFSITSQPINNYVSCKEVVERVAELALSFVTINKVNGKVELKKAFDPFMRGYTHSELSAFTHEQLSLLTHYEMMNAIGLEDEVVDKGAYWTFKTEDYLFGQYGYNTLTLKISQVEGENNSKSDIGLIASDGVVELSIVDNPFINTEALRLSVIDTMFDEIWGYKYYPYTLEYRGFPYLELGDITQIINYDGGEFNSPIYEMTLRYDGGIYGKLNAKALSLTETKYRNSPSLPNRVRNAEIKVDKVEGQISLVASDLDTINGQISSINLDLDGVEISVAKYENGELTGTYYNFDGDAFTITNALDEVVFSADSLGNLTLIGDIKGVKDGVVRTELTENSLKFFEDDGVTSFSMYSNNGMYLTTSTLMNGTEDYSAISMYSNNYPYMPAYVSMTASEAFEEGTNIMNSCTVQVGGNLSTRVYSAIMSGTNNQGLNSVIRAQSDGAIWLYSSNTSYYIYIGGSYKLITVDGSGFLKAT